MTNHVVFQSLQYHQTTNTAARLVGGCSIHKSIYPSNNRHRPRVQVQRQQASNTSTGVKNDSPLHNKNNPLHHDILPLFTKHPSTCHHPRLHARTHTYIYIFIHTFVHTSWLPKSFLVPFSHAVSSFSYWWKTQYAVRIPTNW